MNPNENNDYTYDDYVDLLEREADEEAKKWAMRTKEELTKEQEKLSKRAERQKNKA